MKDVKFIVSNQLKQLGMIEAKFDAVFTDFDGLSIDGVDSIEFQFMRIKYALIKKDCFRWRTVTSDVSSYRVIHRS